MTGCEQAEKMKVSNGDLMKMQLKLVDLQGQCSQSEAESTRLAELLKEKEDQNTALCVELANQAGQTPQLVVPAAPEQAEAPQSPARSQQEVDRLRDQIKVTDKAYTRYDNWSYVANMPTVLAKICGALHHCVCTGATINSSSV